MVRKFVVSLFTDRKSILEESLFTKLLRIFIFFVLFNVSSQFILFIDISTASPDHEMSYDTVYGQFMGVLNILPGSLY